MANKHAEGSATPSPAEKQLCTILLVDDENGVRRLVARLLSASGFRVLMANNSRSAEPMWKQHKHEIDLLLTDLVMPQGVNGRQLAEKLLKEKPTLKVILTSGYHMELSGRDARFCEGINFVQKPYRPDQLLQAVRKALAGVISKSF